MDEYVMSPGRVIVTGAGGFTGGHACRLLAGAGWEVVAVGSPRSDPEFGAGICVAAAERCDLADEAAVRQLIRRWRPEALLHLAGQNAVDVSWRAPASAIAANLMSTVHLLEAVRLVDAACRVVVVGSMLRFPTDRSAETGHPYAFSKMLQVMAAEAWNRWYGIHAIVAEPSNLIGPGGSTGICGKIARWAVRVESGEETRPFILSSLKEVRDFLDVRDAVWAYEMLLRKGEPGCVYALESGSLRTLADVKDAFDAEAGRKLAWQVSDAARESPVPRNTAPIRKMGWKPAIPFRQSVKDVLDEERRKLRQDGKGLA